MERGRYAGYTPEELDEQKQAIANAAGEGFGVGGDVLFSNSDLYYQLEREIAETSRRTVPKKLLWELVE